MSTSGIEVGHGVEVVAVWGEQNGYRFAIALSSDAADDLAARLTEQARYASEVPVDDDAARPTCPRCGSPRWVSVSLDGGYTCRAQCVPCGAYHRDTIGPGWRSPRFNDPEAVHPAYRPVQPDSEAPRE